MFVDSPTEIKIFIFFCSIEWASALPFSSVYNVPVTSEVYALGLFCRD